jgi:hypothetical protein
MKEEYWETIVEGIREARRSVGRAQEHVERFRSQMSHKVGTPIEDQWKDFCAEAANLEGDAKELHEHILRRGPSDGMFLRHPVQ